MKQGVGIEQPVFFDQSGNRWKGVKHGLLLLTLLFVDALVWIIPQVRAPALLPHSTSLTAHATKGQPVNPRELAYSLDRKNMTVLGQGTLVRVVRAGSNRGVPSLIDPFSQRAIRALSDEEREILGNGAYALERYGSTSEKRIALTFDDGPDPTYTPQVLDILSRAKVPSTFFVVGSNVTKFPEIARRIVREGHSLGNHTFTHVDFDFVSSARAQEEINATERVIRAVTKKYTAYFRLPYGGDDDESLKDNLVGILQAQQLGYTVASYDIDTRDWLMGSGREEDLPELDGGSHVVLLHDAGGNRGATVEYLPRLIAAAKAQGYEFATLDQLYAPQPHLAGEATRSLADSATLLLSQLVLVVPSRLMYSLFLLGVIGLLAIAGIHIVLAWLQPFFQKGREKASYHPLVSVVIPAHNEGTVIEETVLSILQSSYRNVEVIVVDDGSTDATSDKVRPFQGVQPVRLINKENGGKASALNRGIAEAAGEIIVTLDADTQFAPSTIGHLVRHFVDPAIGAVAGTVKVGNRKNLLTAWQALEYITSIAMYRRGQSLLGAITIVPGACAAWRKAAILTAGGFSSSTLAEDCDLTLAIQKTSYRVVQDNEAIAYTEAPQSIAALAKQRFRWTFGNLQSLWKHRDMLGKRRYGFLGLFILPYTIVSILVPLLFFPLIVGLMVKMIVAGEMDVVLRYMLLFGLVHFAISIIGVALARERLSHLLVAPLYRLLYEPLWMYLLYRSFFTALKGSRVRWNKLSRTGSVDLSDRAIRPMPLP